MVFNGLRAGRTASCREALGRHRNWQSCVSKRGCVLLCCSCLSKLSFVELGKAESSKPFLYTMLDLKLVLIACTFGVTDFDGVPLVCCIGDLREKGA